MYADTSRNLRTARDLWVSAIFASNQVVLKDVTQWLTRTHPIRVVTYETTGFPTNREDYDEPGRYPPAAIRASLPVVPCAKMVTRLDIDVAYLTNVPKLIAMYCEGADIRGLRVAFRTHSRPKDGHGYFRQYKDVVAELRDLEVLCVREEVELRWVEMEQTFGGYPPADQAQYCAGYLEPVGALVAGMRRNWLAKFEPWSLPFGDD